MVLDVVIISNVVIINKLLYKKGVLKIFFVHGLFAVLCVCSSIRLSMNLTFFSIERGAQRSREPRNIC